MCGQWINDNPRVSANNSRNSHLWLGENQHGTIKTHLSTLIYRGVLWHIFESSLTGDKQQIFLRK